MVHCRVIETPHPLSPLAPDLWINQTQKPGPNPLFIPGLILYTGTVQSLILTYLHLLLYRLIRSITAIHSMTRLARVLSDREGDHGA